MFTMINAGIRVVFVQSQSVNYRLDDDLCENLIIPFRNSNYNIVFGQSHSVFLIVLLYSPYIIARFYVLPLMIRFKTLKSFFNYIQFVRNNAFDLSREI